MRQFFSFILPCIKVLAVAVIGVTFFLQKISAAVVINEFLPAPPSGNPEWVEFYNTDASSEDLSTYYFDDDTNFDSDSGSSGKIVLSGLLSSSATCYIELSTYLNNDGDTPTIFKLDGSVIDSYQYASSSADKSYARVPDGGSWQINQVSTKSSSRCSDLAPSPTPTLTPTPKPQNTTTPTSTSIPTKTPPPTASKIPTPMLTLTKQPTRNPIDTPDETPEATPVVLGESVGSDSSSLSAITPNNSWKPLVISILLLATGLAILAGFYAWKIAREKNLS